MTISKSFWQIRRTNDRRPAQALQRNSIAVRSLVLAAVALLCVAAAPFDTYQLIMWQEHTPAEIEGLKRLGFTATKLRATSGQIDPVDRAQRIASGLPWYLENIATDFYSPYHRYRPGKSVTLLFDEAKARRRAKPADSAVFIRDPSLSDPVWLNRIASRLQTLAREESDHSPLFYNLADEAGIGDLAASWDFDIGEPSLVAMREWLRTQYTSLAALNAEWGSDFARWEDVVPEMTDAALRRTDSNYAAWGDFKAWMDFAFARAVRSGTDALHQADATALAALEGCQIPGWGGYDYGQLANTVDIMEIYDIGDSVAVARAANPNLIVLRTSFGLGDGAEAWRNLLQGGRGTIVWDEDNGIVAADGAAKPRGRELAALVAGIRGIAPTLMASTPELDSVAVLVSQASFRTQWLLDRKPGGNAWSERSAGREYEDNVWRASRRETLQRLLGLGIQPHLLTSLQPGALARDGIRVLILPHALALSDVEVAEIRSFAASGGKVLADTEPGLFDSHSRLRTISPLTGVALVPEAMQRAGTPPSQPILQGEATVLASAGVTPRAVFRTVTGSLAPGIEARWFRNGSGELLSIQPIAPYSAPLEIEVEFPDIVTAKDLRRGGPPQSGKLLRLTLEPAEPVILSLSR